MTQPDDRIFNPHGRRHYRRSYSTREVQVGCVVLLGLAAVAGWVFARGQHPDPDLFALGAGLTPQPARDRPDRSPLPPELALTAQGYREGRVSRFGSDNLFEKIDGRADFFKARGFQALTCVTLQHADPNRSIDVELYDMGDAQNALGTYAAERDPGVTPLRVSGAQYHLEPNALFMARGRFYVRAVAAATDPPVSEQLDKLIERFNASLEGAARPWSELLFVDRLGLPAAGVGFMTDNAFSFGFARGVHTATLQDGETQLFVMPASSPAEAAKLADQFVGGFASYGDRDGNIVTDRYLKRVAAVTSQGAFAVGVVSAADKPAATSWLAQLIGALSELPQDVQAQALATSAQAASIPERGDEHKSARQGQKTQDQKTQDQEAQDFDTDDGEPQPSQAVAPRVPAAAYGADPREGAEAREAVDER